MAAQQPRRASLALACAALLLSAQLSTAQLSKPAANDKHWDEQGHNKFLQRRAENDRDADRFEEFAGAADSGLCPLDVELKWMTEVSSSVYATPLITDLYADGRKDIIVPGFVHYTEVLEGPDGAKALGWPGFHRSTVHASPLLYDIDLDGIRDVLVATYDGEVVFFKDNGEQLLDRLYVPRLRVRKNWYVGLNPDPVDHSHPDVGKAEPTENPFAHAAHEAQAAHSHAVGQGAAAHPAPAPPHPPPPVVHQAPPVPQAMQQQAQPAQQQAQQQAQAQAQQQAQQYAQQQAAQQAHPQQAQAQHAQPKQPQPQAQAQAQPHPQQQAQPHAAGTPPPPALAAADQQAVVAFKKQLDDYRKQFGQEAADGMVQRLRSSNPAMYEAVNALIAREKELEQLVGRFGGGGDAAQQQQKQQPQPAAQHAQRRLMSAGAGGAGAEDSSLVEPFALRGSGDSSAAAGSRKQLLQAGDPTPGTAGAGGGGSGAATGGGGGGAAAGGGSDGAAAAGGTGAAAAGGTGAAAAGGTGAAAPGGTGAAAAGGTGAAAAGGGAAAAGGGGGAAAGVEPDPAHAALTQEALDSFKIFDDTAQEQPADGEAAGAANAADGADDADGTDAGADGEAADAALDDLYAGTGDDAGGGSVGAAHHTRLFDYDELGDRWGQAQQEAQQQATGTGATLEATLERQADAFWEEESFTQSQHRLEPEFVYVDAHVLCTPAIADIDGDGHEELVVAVSYFYDREYYDDPAHAHELQGIDKEKYVAGGVVAFDLRTKLLKWQTHLDLTTASTKFTAHVFSSPTLVDVDADGFMEIVLGTSVGFVYVLDHKGTSRPGWPIQMGEVQGQVLVADLNSDGQVEIFAGDALGNVALLDIHGKELWERHIKSMVGQGAVAGDINGDGLLEIVVGTADGRVHALRGTDGADARGFPFQTGGRVQAQATIAPLGGAERGAQHVLVMSFDGFLYAINGASGCAHAVDIGESSYSAVLVDDLCGDGLLELLVATMNGNVYLLQTRAEHHPLKTWPSQVQGINGMVARWNYFGFTATHDARQLRDVAGRELQVQVEVTDQRTLLGLGGVPLPDAPRGPYNVTVVLAGVGVAEMNTGPQPVIGLSDLVPKPGKAVVAIPCPRTRTTAAVHLDLVTPHRLHYQDEFVVSFHMHFHKLLKWLIALPLLAMAVVVLVIGQAAGYDEAKSYHLG